MKHIIALLTALLLMHLAPLRANELTVGTGGFKTIAEGVAALKPGDILTIMPGEYRETVSATLVGTAEAPVTIRAWRAGSVLLRGDVDLMNFKLAPGLRDVFVTEFKQRVESVFERSTFRTLEPKLSPAEVELSLMSFHHDEQRGLLYVHTSDSLPPECHAMGASVTNANGLLLSGSKHVVVDGLSFTGFSHRDHEQQQGSRTRWGLLLKDCDYCNVRRCVSYLNSGGIHVLGKGRGCVVEDSVAFGNWSRHVDIGNNIVGWAVAGVTFRGNRVEGHMPDAGTSRNDITFYSGGDGCAMVDNLAINASVMIKGDLKDAVQRGNLCVGRKFYRPPGTENVELPNGPSAQDAAKFADVLNHDYRLAEGSADGKEQTVFFVSPRGDDEHPGTKSKPWRTLGRASKVGGTVYLMAGEYDETLTPGDNADVRRHGHDLVVVKSIAVQDRVGVRLHGLRVKEGITVSNCDGLRMEFCVVGDPSYRRDSVANSATGSRGNEDSLAVTRSPHLHCSHNWLHGALRVVDSPGGSFHSNIIPQRSFDAASQHGLWLHSNVETAPNGDVLKADSLLIGRGLHGSTIGPFLRLSVKRPLPIAHVAVHDVTDTTATLEWSTPTQAAETTLEWGESKIETARGNQHSVSMIGLQPGRTYEFRVTSLRKDEQRVFATHEPVAATFSRRVGDKMSPVREEPATTPQAVVNRYTVTTAAKRAAARTLHVPADYSTIAAAAEAARAGDTVLIHGGVYEETVRVRSSGDVGAPITFKSAPGETVWIDGSNRFRANAFILPNKHHIVLDGLRFRHFRFAPELGPIIQLSGGSQQAIRRCFHDGREIEGYVGTLIGATKSRDVLIENNVFINGMGEAISLNNCPDATVRHCVFYNNFIRAMTAHMNEPNVLLHFHHNLVCDSIPSKVNNALLRIWHADALRSDHNVFFTRIPGDERRIVETAFIHGKQVGHADPATYRGETLLLSHLRESFRQELQSRTGNPGIRATPRLVPRNDNDESDWRKIEMHRNGGTFEPLDFADFIPSADNPLAKAQDGKPIGLEADAFP